MSSKQQPMSRSSCVRHDSAAASGSSTVSLIKIPALFAAVTRFCVAATDEVTKCTLASRRCPTMPMASRIPSCASTINSCGKTCSTSRSTGNEMFREASTARRTSSRSISRARLPSVTPPRLFTPFTWLPATPIKADSTGTFATLSASSTARRIELTVESRFTIRPLRRPLDSAAPSARNFICCSSISAINTHVFVLPISSPTRYLSFLATPLPPTFTAVISFCSRYGTACAGVRIDNHLARVLQIHRAHAPGIGLPLRKIFHQHAVFTGKLSAAEMHGDCLGVGRIGNSRHGIGTATQPGDDRAQIFRIGQFDFADAVGITRALQIDVLNKFLIDLHALFPLFTRQIFADAGDDGKMQIFALGTIQDDALRIHEREFVANFEECDRRALGQFHAQAIGQNALHGGGFHPRQLLEFAAPRVQRDAQDAVVAVAEKRLQHRFARHNVIAGQLDLFFVKQKHFRRVQQKIHAGPRGADAHNAQHAVSHHALVQRPVAPAKFFAPNFQRLLAAQVARFFVGDQLRTIVFGFSRSRRCATGAGDGFYASHSTTSCSSVTPKFFATRSRTSVISESMSEADALPAFTKKFACRSLTRASPTLKPLRPSSSIMRPAAAPGGFLKMHPALFCPSGWLARRFSLQIRIPWRISLNGLEGSSSFTASIISSGAKEVCRYSNEICSPRRVSSFLAAAR